MSLSTIIPSANQNGTGATEAVTCPDFLRPFANERRWVWWQQEFRRDREEPYKIPYQPSTGGKPRRADTTDPATWGTFEQARIVNQHHDGAGIGFLLNGDGITVLDLDDSRDIGEGDVTSYAYAALRAIEAPVEISVSEEGLHVWFRADPNLKLPPNKSGRFELYRDERFIAVTGLMEPRFDFPTLPERTVELCALLNIPLPKAAFNEDAAIIERLQQKDAARELWLGNWQQNYESQSEADLALCNYISLYTRGADQIERIFGESGLVRDKWLKRADYRERTINKALADRDVNIDFGNQSAAYKPSNKRFRFLTVAEALEQPLPTYLIDGYIPEKSLAMVYGPSKSGKTFVCIDMALCVALGREWQGHKTKQGLVIYLAAEGSGGLRKRLDAWLRHNNVSSDEVENIQLLYDTANLMNPAEVDALIEAIRTLDEPPCLMFIDTVAWSMIGGDENSAKDTGRLMEATRRIREEFGTTCVLVHHTGHSASNPRGSSAFLGNADAIMKVEPLQPNRLRLTVEKQKDDETQPAKTFERKIIPLPELSYTTTGGREVTSCVIVQCDEVQANLDDFAVTSNEKQQAIIDALRTFGADGATDKQIRETAKDCATGGPRYKEAKETLEHKRTIVSDSPPKTRNRRYWLAEFFPGAATEVRQSDVEEEEFL